MAKECSNCSEIGALCGGCENCDICGHNQGCDWGDEVKPVDPLTGWAVKTGGGALVARLGTLRVYIDRLGSMTIQGDEDGAELLGAYARVDAIEALIALWREAQS